MHANAHIFATFNVADRNAEVSSEWVAYYRTLRHSVRERDCRIAERRWIDLRNRCQDALTADTASATRAA